ncbi:MAG: murein transglycosylase A [Gallionellaceae bacterium]|nr:murein transglycosylase A [Gallionellaceae bacterium]
MRCLSLLAVCFLAGCQTLAPKIDEVSHEPAPVAAPAQAEPPAPSPAPTPAPAPVTEIAPPAPAPEIKTMPVAMDWLKPGAWTELPGWKSDDLKAAWPAWLQSCAVMQRQSAWRDVCAGAVRMTSPEPEQIRAYFQKRFTPYQIQQAEGGAEGLVTGYYEPLLRGSRSLTPKYRYPVRAPPDDLLVVDLGDLYPELKTLRLRGRLDGNKVVPYFTRGDIEAGRTPAPGREIAWVDDPVELFFLQVQGSGRIQLDNGDQMRVGYADHNGYPYRSIGKWLVERGELTLDKASMQGIKDWAREHPDRLPELLATNPSYVFFRELPNQDGGPLGALGVPITPERSIAVDPRATPLGAPVWLATTRPNSSEALNRLVLAQDTGGAIKGNVRADLFWGFGDDAGRLAGAMKQKGRMWLLLPRDYPLTSGGGRNGL